MVLFLKRYADVKPPATPASVKITGAGDAANCYVTINGTKYYAAKSGVTVMTGDTITFGVYGRSSQYSGIVTIDGTQVLKVTDKTTKTYNWAVPDGVKNISIDLNVYTGKITVTTTK